jgi:hypothetical protein
MTSQMTAQPHIDHGQSRSRQGGSDVDVGGDSHESNADISEEGGVTAINELGERTKRANSVEAINAPSRLGSNLGQRRPEPRCLSDARQNSSSTGNSTNEIQIHGKRVASRRSKHRRGLRVNSHRSICTGVCRCPPRRNSTRSPPLGPGPRRTVDSKFSAHVPTPSSSLKVADQVESLLQRCLGSR